jgi:hypothetical protein
VKEMIKFAYCIVLLVISVSFSSAQTKLSSEAELLYRAENYTEALSMYEDIIRSYPTNSIYNHRYGVCLYETGGDLQKATKHLRYALSKGIKLSNYYLAMISMQEYRFAEAIEYFQQYKAYLRHSDPRQKEIDRHIQTCRTATDYLSSVDNISITDTLIVPFNGFFKHFIISSESGAISDKQIDMSEVNDSLFSLYIPQKRDRAIFSEFIESKNNYDIRWKNRNFDSWSISNTGFENINTSGNEIFPFIMSDGITMYYTSNQEGSLGGYDIYVTRYNAATNTFLPPQNMGMPYNSVHNDYFLVIDEFKNTGWFATDRNTRKGYVTIYRFTPNNVRQNIQTDDNNLLRNKALLRNVTFKEAGSSVATSTAENNVLTLIEPKKEPAFNFVVNDTTIYTDFNDFKNRDAATTFKLYLKNRDKTDSIATLLTRKRTIYSESTSNDEKNTLASEIPLLEAKMMKISASSDSLSLRTKLLETIALKAYQKKLLSDKNYRSPWEPIPFTVNVPENPTPSFFNPALSKQYKQVFTDNEISQLVEAEKLRLTADNLFMEQQQLLPLLNQQPKDFKMPDFKHIIRKDSVFTEPLTHAQMAQLVDQLKLESAEKYVQSFRQKYEVLQLKNELYLRQLPQSMERNSIKNMIEEADFQYINAASTTNNFSELQYLNFDQIREVTGRLESSIDILERCILSNLEILHRAQQKSEQEKSAMQEKTTLVSKITYKVQIGLFRNAPNATALAKIPPVTSEPVENSELTRYYSGNFDDKAEAEKVAADIEKAGFPGAFVVPFINGKRVTWNQINTLK